MGLFAQTLKATIPRVQNFAATVPVWQAGRAQLPNNRYETYAREGYSKNELIYACIEELSTSAAEPKMQARYGEQWSRVSPILSLLNRPNPFLSYFEFWATIIMHRSLAGNAYALKVRSASQKVVELWLMRPDRVRIVPSQTTYIDRYIYNAGVGQVYEIAPRDVIHFKNRNPLDDWYGMPPLMPASGRTDIDNYMKDFVKAAFQNGGMPGAVLSVKQKVSEEQKEAIKNRFRNNFAGPSGWHELLILDNAESTYTPMSMSLGARGLVIPELDEIEEARIPMVFGVPQSLIGTRTSYQNGGYANKRAESQDFWTGTLTPLYKELAGPLNLRLVPEFSGVDEVAFDLTDVWALQPDQTAIAERAAKLVMSGVWTVEEGRRETGKPENPPGDDVYLVPANLIPTPARLLVPVEESAPPENPPPPEPVVASNGNGTTP
jgi:HK97 family phage portal protein